jgi:anaerobic C4-dicarboxylate transporter
MISGQFEPPGQQRFLRSQRKRLLQQHPVLIPVILITGSVTLYVASFFADNLFPLLALIGVPTGLLCLSIALVAGVSGILASIISIIEGIDRRRLRTATFPKPKGA